MRPEDTIRIQHMAEAAETALGFVAGRAREDLERDTMLAFAVARALEIVGEAASKVGPETRQAFPDISWAAIMGMRNRLAHAYHDINFDILWMSATHDLPTLLPRLRAALASDAPPP